MARAAWGAADRRGRRVRRAHPRRPHLDRRRPAGIHLRRALGDPEHLDDYRPTDQTAPNGDTR